MEPAEIKSAIERSRKAVELKPSLAQVNMTTVVKLMGGLTCEVTNGNWKFTVDEPAGLGGDDTAPDPGVYGRGALGSCLAVSYAIWFSLLEVPYQGVEVEINAARDVRGALGMDDQIPTGYGHFKVKARIISDAPRADVEKAMEAAEKHSPWLYNFTQPFKIEHDREISLPTTQAEAG